MKAADRELVRMLIDGEASPAELTELERRCARSPRLRRYRDEMLALRGELGALSREGAAVFAPPVRLPAPEPPARRSRWTWWAVPVSFASALAVLLLLLPPTSPDEVTAIGTVPVKLTLRAPTARSVAVAGDFNDWRPEVHPLRDDDGDGHWVAELELPKGQWAYMFVVDSTQWLTDPNALAYRDDGFGSRNGILDL